MIAIDYKKIKIKLHDGSENLDKFDCEHDDLNEFLKKDSIEQKEWMLNSTYLAIYENEVIGFFTLSTDIIKIKNLGQPYKEKFKNKVNYNEFPAIKIGRLGVSSSHKKKRIGTYLLQRIFNKSIELSEKIGLRFVTIDAYLSSHGFYKKNYCEDSFNNAKLKKEFNKFNNAHQKDLQTANNMTVPMFMDLHDFRNRLQNRSP